MTFDVSFNGLGGQDLSALDPHLSPTFFPLVKKLATSNDVSAALHQTETRNADTYKVFKEKIQEYKATASLTQIAFLEYIAHSTIVIIEKNAREILSTIQKVQEQANASDEAIKTATGYDPSVLAASLAQFDDVEKVKQTRETIKGCLIDMKDDPLVCEALKTLTSIREQHLKIEKPTASETPAEKS